MLKKILFFRTDAIGDLIVNCPSIITIKNNFQNTEVSLVCSNKNITYASARITGYPEIRVPVVGTGQRLSGTPMHTVRTEAA